MSTIKRKGEEHSMNWEWKRTFEFPCWKVVTCYQSYNYERFDWNKFSEAFHTFCIYNGIKRRKLTFSPPSSNGSWYYHYEIKCTGIVFEELKKYIDETLKNMGV